MKQQLVNARRVLATATKEPSAAEAEITTTTTTTTATTMTPQLTVQVMQKNLSTLLPIQLPSVEQLPTSVISPRDYGYTGVSQAFTCNLKEGAAVKCNIAFTSSSLNDAYRPGADSYLVLSLNTPGQVGSITRAVPDPC